MSRRKLRFPKFKYPYKKQRSIVKSTCRTNLVLNAQSQHYVLTNQEEIGFISRYILDHKSIETGGQLFGYWTHDGNPVVLYVLGPGHKDGHYGTYFMQDLEYLKTRAAVLMSKYGLSHIGEWHSHHQLGLAHPSGHDAKNITSNMAKLGYKKFLLCIGTCTNETSTINSFMFDENNSEYEEVPWNIKQIKSPYRYLIESQESDFSNPPKVIEPNVTNLYVVDEKNSYRKKVQYKASYWLKKPGNSKILKLIIDSIEDSKEQCKCTPIVSDKTEVYLVISLSNINTEVIHFPSEFPLEAPNITDTRGNLLINKHEWFFDGDIYNSFIKFYKSHKTI